MRTRRLAIGLLAAALASGCGESISHNGCAVTGNTIVCTGETLDACAVAGCSIADLNCQDPPAGCEIAPGAVLAHYSEKPPNDFYLCASGTCGTWTEANCQVTVTLDAGGSLDYTIRDPGCP